MPWSTSCSIADGRADLAGRAIAALKTFMTHERALQRVQLVAFRETFDSGDFAAVVNHCERETRVDAPAVDEDRAGAALAVIAAFLRAGQIECSRSRSSSDMRGSSTQTVVGAVNAQTYGDGVGGGRLSGG